MSNRGLNAQFVVGVSTGGWITGRAWLRKLTRTTAFLDAEASAGDDLLPTATAILPLLDAPSTPTRPDGKR